MSIIKYRKIKEINIQLSSRKVMWSKIINQCDNAQSDFILEKNVSDQSQINQYQVNHDITEKN